MIGYIYLIKNDINDKKYIGKTTKKIEDRFKEHCKDCKKKRMEKRPLYNAMNLYGIEHFSIEKIEEVNDIKQLEEKEKYWINYFDTYREGYNATLGGDGKILFDYNQIIELYNQGFIQKEIARKVGCSTDTVSKVLLTNNIESSKNKNKKMMHPISAEKSNEIFYFNSQMEAANWLIQNKYTTSIDPDNICGSIGRALKKENKKYLGFIWKYLY